MYCIQKISYECASGFLSRYLSSAEVSTALRPFYFSVHPDLFGKYPEQRKINENSLQQLSALIEAQQSSRKIVVPPLSFYLRKKDMPEGEFKLIKIKLDSNNVRDTVVRVLSACNMPTLYVDKIPENTKRNKSSNTSFNKYDFHKASKEYSDDFEQVRHMKREVAKEKSATNIVEWVTANCRLAKTKYESAAATRMQVQTLISELCETYGIKQVKYDSGWNMSHIRGALQSLVALASQHPNVMKNLEGRTIALGQFTGVSLDGDVFLSIIDVRNEWLSLIKKVSQEDSALVMIPNYEKALSSILRNIHICRRKFMPKVSAHQYCSHLRQLITSIGDYYGRGAKFPDNIPESLKGYQIVVEPEAGPLMVSPTGQFITPSSCPAEELIAYLSKNLDQATILMTEYSINKHVEKAIHKEVKDRFGLLDLQKDDSITPAMMISCCERLLTGNQELQENLNGTNFYVTHYYSVLSEGILCIPWNFKCNSKYEAFQTTPREVSNADNRDKEIDDSEWKMQKTMKNNQKITKIGLSESSQPSPEDNEWKGSEKRKRKEKAFVKTAQCANSNSRVESNEKEAIHDEVRDRKKILIEKIKRRQKDTKIPTTSDFNRHVFFYKQTKKYKDIGLKRAILKERVKVEPSVASGSVTYDTSNCSVAFSQEKEISPKMRERARKINEELQRWRKEPQKIPTTSDFNKTIYDYKQGQKRKKWPYDFPLSKSTFGG